ncbi:MAG: hypothetical protein ABR956_16955, partial [Terracidiphilus sp.]
TTFLAHKLSVEVRTRNAGAYRGWVSVPENTTLIFYGPDAEALFSALEPLLKGDSTSSGARVVIRQGVMHREAFIPHQSCKLN